MMKKIAAISALGLAICIAFTGCGDKREPGRVYMPDMAYSRAYEAYAMRDSSKFTMEESEKGGLKIYYNAEPVAGTLKKGEEFPYTLPNDSTGYKMSATVKNPLGDLSEKTMKEAQRLFNINCAICHDEKGTGTGPVGNRLGSVANLTQQKFIEMADGTMFHSITYGKNLMGSYASQVSREQRWMIIKYIRTLQPHTETKAAAADTTATTNIAVVVDTTKKSK